MGPYTLPCYIPKQVYGLQWIYIHIYTYINTYIPFKGKWPVNLFEGHLVLKARQNSKPAMATLSPTRVQLRSNTPQRSAHVNSAKAPYYMGLLLYLEYRWGYVFGLKLGTHKAQNSPKAPYNMDFGGQTP